MEYYTNLLNKIKKKEVKVAVVGLGYIGLNLAIEIAKEKFKCIGIEIDKEKINALKKGESYLENISSKTLKETMKTKLKVTDSYEEIKYCDIIILAVQTPLDVHKNPNLSFLKNSIENIYSYIHNGSLIILESTVYPGATEELLAKKIQEKFKIGEEIFIAYSPERIDPGNKKFTIKNIPKIVGGITEKCSILAKEFYEKIINSKIYIASSTKVAEMAKLLENMFRLVNISLTYQLVTLCDKMNIDIWEVIELAKTKPFGFMPFYPGPGAGGHCIPIDPQYLLWKAREYNVLLEFINLATRVNEEMIEYIVKRIGEILNKEKKPIKNSKIFIVGVSYKKDIADTRESAALKIINILEQMKAEINYHDPYVPKIKIKNKEMKSMKIESKIIKEQDLVVILTDHSNIDYKTIIENAKIIYDTRNVFNKYKRKGVYKLGAGIN